jgi:Zn-dependent metalloprotease
VTIKRIKAPTAPLRLQRLIHDAGSSTTIPGRLIRAEGDPPAGDLAGDEVYDGLGLVAQFFHDIYGRNSLDDRGGPIAATVHYGRDYMNAFWNGKQLIFGDGDGELFGRFTAGIDIIGYYFMRGVTHFDMKVDFWGQAGALSTSLADVFGSLAKQYALGQKATEADWLIGADIVQPGFRGKAIRSLSAPGTAYDDRRLGKDPQPDHMRHFIETPTDNGGVHFNCGIPNRAFYLAAVGIGGYAWERIGQVWYQAQRARGLPKTATFADFAQMTLRIARKLYGGSDLALEAIAEGWKTVGVLPAVGSEG